MPEGILGWLIVAAFFVLLVAVVLVRARRRGRGLSTADMVRRRRELQQQLQDLAGDAGSQLAQLEGRRLGEASTSLAALEAAIARAEKIQSRERETTSLR